MLSFDKLEENLNARTVCVFEGICQCGLFSIMLYLLDLLCVQLGQSDAKDLLVPPRMNNFR